MSEPLTEKIRTLLTDAFDEENFTHLCFDHYKKDVYDRFASGMTRTEKIQILIEHCVRQEQVYSLITLLKSQRPEQFEKIIGDENVVVTYFEDVFKVVRHSGQPEALRKLQNALRQLVHHQKRVNELKVVHNLLHDILSEFHSVSYDMNKPDEVLHHIVWIEKWYLSASRKIQRSFHSVAEEMITIQPPLVITDNAVSGPQWAKDIAQVQYNITISLQERNAQELGSLWRNLLDTCMDHLYRIDRDLLKAVEKLDRLSEQILNLVGDESTET